jgi:hypothetical protein
MAPFTAALAASAMRIACAAVVTDVETLAHAVVLPDGTRWYDVTPMLSPQEQPPELIDMTSEALAFGLAMGVLSFHPQHAHLVRVHPRCPPACQAGPVQH